MSKLRNMIRKPHTDDAGVAVILVVAWSIGLLMLALVLTQSAINMIRSSDRSEHFFDSLAAAEAGVDDYIARLAQNDAYYLISDNDSANPAVRGWAQVPGGTSSGQFTYVTDSSKAESTGEIIIYSTGRSGPNVDPHYRTIKTIIKRPSTINFSYLSSFETYDPDLPGAYNTAPGSGPYPPQSEADYADQYCRDRLYWQTRGPLESGTYRTTNCKSNPIGVNDDLKFGISHTNDLWYIDDSTGNNYSNQLPTGNSPWNGLSSGCPTTPQNGIVNSPCTANHLWLSNGSAGLTAGQRAEGSQPWNPEQAPVEELPSVSPDGIKDKAVEAGCVFYGPTRIRFFSTGSAKSAQGYMAVTSPNTKTTKCRGVTVNTLSSSIARPDEQPTVVFRTDIVPGEFNGVISIKSSPSSAGDPNRWAGKSPACEPKAGSMGSVAFPYVIPSQDRPAELSGGMPWEDDLWNNKGNRTKDWEKGFPSIQTDPNSQWFQADSCDEGDLYLQGEMTGQMTIVAEGDIALTGHTMYADSRTNAGSIEGSYGKPASKSENILGIVAEGGFIYNYNPVSTETLGGGGSKVTDWLGQQGVVLDGKYQPNKQGNVIYNFVAVSNAHCLTTQNWNATGSGQVATDLGVMHLWGSVSQRYGCPVGNNQVTPKRNYAKYVNFDRRLLDLSPPYLTSISDMPWQRGRVSETNEHIVPAVLLGAVADTGTQAAGSQRTWNVLSNDAAGLTIERANIRSGAGSVTLVNGQVVFNAPLQSGTTTVIEYLVTDGSELSALQTLTIRVT